MFVTVQVQCKDLPHFKYETEAWKKRVGYLPRFHTKILLEDVHETYLVSLRHREIAQLFKDEKSVFKGRSSKEVPADGFPEVSLLQIIILGLDR